MASKRRIRRRACENKRRFETETQAVAMAVHLRKKSAIDYRGSAYPCGDHWHVGRKPRRK
jgi:hypothetical protein